ncbi:MAG: AAA family ATPase [Bacteroidota bacterium]|nr:AAA family ATPase [Bacteroidota bacterium]MDP3144451.1 AAA family ATPase [Bacteroidota bacterium]MDP3555871.1 AAA family ATPase [Bacteroidota bacterium]
MEKRFKYKSLLTFCNNEWMVNNQKRYRTTLDKAEIDYVRVELAIFNKLFDEEDWAAKVNLKCVENVGKKEICNREINISVKKEENIFYLRDGWGVEAKGTFWKKGSYLWQAYIDDVFVGEKLFHINDIGEVTTTSNPYLEIEHIKLYNSHHDGWQEKNRKYLKTFSKNDTKYVWAEVKFKNITALDYHYEFFVNFHDDSGQQKASVIQTGFVDVNKKDYTYTFEKAWGSDTPGIWTDDKYLVEIVFNDVLIGATTFNCALVEEEGETPLLKTIEQTLTAGNASTSSGINNNEGATEKTLEELLSELDALIGLDNVKKSIRENITYLNFTKLRKEKGFDDSSKISLHSIFTGNPGTGKTTVVKMLGKIYNKMGLLSKGHVVEVDRAALVGEYIGQTAPKTKKMIESARGGILFIDEAYSLARSDDDSKDFGKEVIEMLLKEMSDGPGDIAIIGAGYPKQIKSFIESNPGLKSRFTEYFHFDDYLPEELHQIAVYSSAQKQIGFSPEADNYLKEQLIEAYRKRDEHFGNARFVNAIVEEAKQNMGIRLMKSTELDNLTKEDLSTISLEDLVVVFFTEQKKQLKLSINDKQLNEALAELNELVGMDKIKQDIHELVKLIRFYNETGKDVVNKFSLHSVFSGNPGTGKTTLARIIAKIYKALGVIERGHVVEVDREGLVAGYVGQTATKTAGAIENAMGGILFIDEAYALAGNGGNDFGNEAIQVILKRMEDMRGKFGIIVAGYTDNMSTFIQSNPGLKSRFDKTFVFDDYQPEQLWDITKNLLLKESLTPNPEAETHLRAHIANLYDSRDKFFGNARTARQVVGDVVMKQNLRLASMPSDQRKKEDLAQLIFDDVKHLPTQITENRQTLGYKFGS